MAVERQPSTLPPAQPSYILRGHASQIHSVQLLRRNTRLLTGDADGWVIYWKLETKRALAVWKAHDGAILGTAEWGPDKIVTHGRDNNLRIWQLRQEDESALSTALPAEVALDGRPMPWLLHTLPVNTLNFCAFSMCYASIQAGLSDNNHTKSGSRPAAQNTHASVLIAVPARDDKKAEVYQFPDEKLRYVVPRAQSKDTGMVMAVKLVQDRARNLTLVITGYEGGITAVHLLPRNDDTTIGVAQLVYISQPHTQPILSIDVLPDVKRYYTSGADSIIAAHSIPYLPSTDGYSQTSQLAQADEDDPPVSVTSQHFVTAPSRASRIVSRGADTETVADDPPVSIPETVNEDPLSFSKRPVHTASSTRKSTARTGGLSSLLSDATPLARAAQTPPQPSLPSIETPIKVNNTKHAGQQSLSVRSDGRIIATGGWDSRIRIYSAKTLKEVAVLKWHKEGVYAVAFGEILDATAMEQDMELSQTQEADGEVARRETGLSRLQRQREEKMQVKHWVVAGAKDGKVSLWEVF